MWGVVPEGALQRIVVVSPHFDDAALGGAHLLSSYPGTTVITVCGGPPESYPDEPTDWDTLGGFVAKFRPDVRASIDLDEVDAMRG